jgi:ABC-2 type transport system ATP-binding protein
VLAVSSREPIIVVQELRKHFGDTKALDGISFTVEKGEIFGFLGPNGGYLNSQIIRAT